MPKPLSDEQKAKRLEKFLAEPPKRLERKTVLKREARSIAPKVRERLYEQQKHTCHYCRKGTKRNDFTVDHMLPLSKGGDNAESNLVGACVTCNREKGDKTAEEYLAVLTDRKEAIAAKHRAEAMAKKAQQDDA